MSFILFHYLKKLIKLIICPECNELALLNIEDFKLNFYFCKNGHEINNILLNEFEECQKINMNKLICNICNKQNILNSLFFVCNECNKNICPLCKLTHDKNHIIINYEDRDYICKKHNEPFNKYCKTCDEDICFICEDDHVADKIDDLNEILDNKNEFIIINQDLKDVIEKFKCKINIMKEILNRMINMLEIYYNINNNFINNYSFNKINYFKLQNFITLKAYTI